MVEVQDDSRTHAHILAHFRGRLLEQGLERRFGLGKRGRQQFKQFEQQFRQQFRILR